MKNRIFNVFDILTGTLLAGFLLFLILASTQLGMNFDSAYNMLSYVNLFNGQGFRYVYDVLSVPFDPVISTGPELYFPTFLLWKIFGRIDFYMAVYVFIAYYAIFLGGVLFYFIKEPKKRFFSLLIFLLLFFANRHIFDYFMLLDPLGEVIASFFIFTGIYFLAQRRWLLSAVLLSLGLDVKTNIVMGLLPVLGIFFLLEYLLPAYRNKNYKKLPKEIAKFALIGIIIFVPYLTYTKILPRYTLSRPDRAVVWQAQADRQVYMINRGLGQINALAHNLDSHGLRDFFNATAQKMPVLKGYYQDSYWLYAVFLASLFLFMALAYRQKHFSLYLFLFSFFMMLWWLFGTTDAWYRYYFLTEYLYLLGLFAFLPELYGQTNKKIFLPAALLLLVVFLPQMSLASIKNHFRPQARQESAQMAAAIKDIPENQIFADGWFQCPQMMFLTGKHFQDYQNTARLEKAKATGQELYFVTSGENVIIKEEMERIEKNLELIKEFGGYKLYRIKHQ